MIAGSLIAKGSASALTLTLSSARAARGSRAAWGPRGWQDLIESWLNSLPPRVLLAGREASQAGFARGLPRGSLASITQQLADAPCMSRAAILHCPREAPFAGAPKGRRWLRSRRSA